jgi:lauroyl/myristoyl acyltransferase
MTTMTALIEERIRRDPTQWMWIHDRWKRRPDATGTNLANSVTEE